MDGSPVSVVIPARNEAATIGAVLTAVLTQLGPDDEIVVVDNGSTDRTGHIVERFARQDARVRRVIEPRRGVNRARNAGVRSARRQLVLHVDADDVPRPIAVAQLRAVLATDDLVGGRVQLVDEADRPIRVEGVTPPGPGLPVVRGYAAPWGCACGYRRQVWEHIGGFDERMTLGGDETDFFLRAQLAGARLGWTDDVVVDYRIPLDRAFLRERNRRTRRHMMRSAVQGKLTGAPRGEGFVVSPDAGSSASTTPSRSAGSRVERLISRTDRVIGVLRFGPGELLAVVRRSGWSR